MYSTNSENSGLEDHIDTNLISQFLQQQHHPNNALDITTSPKSTDIPTPSHSLTPSTENAHNSLLKKEPITIPSHIPPPPIHQTSQLHILPKFISYSELLNHLYHNSGVEPSMVLDAIENNDALLLIEIICFILARPASSSLAPGTRFNEETVITMLGINQGYKKQDQHYNILLKLLCNLPYSHDIIDIIRILRSSTIWTATSFRTATQNSPFVKFKQQVSLSAHPLHYHRHCALSAAVLELTFLPSSHFSTWNTFCGRNINTILNQKGFDNCNEILFNPQGLRHSDITTWLYTDDVENNDFATLQNPIISNSWDYHYPNLEHLRLVEHILHTILSIATDTPSLPLLELLFPPYNKTLFPDTPKNNITCPTTGHKTTQFFFHVLTKNMALESFHKDNDTLISQSPNDSQLIKTTPGRLAASLAATPYDQSKRVKQNAESSKISHHYAPDFLIDLLCNRSTVQLFSTKYASYSRRISSLKIQLQKYKESNQYVNSITKIPSIEAEIDYTQRCQLTSRYALLYLLDLTRIDTISNYSIQQLYLTALVLKDDVLIAKIQTVAGITLETLITYTNATRFAHQHDMRLIKTHNHLLYPNMEISKTILPVSLTSQKSSKHLTTKNSCHTANDTNKDLATSSASELTTLEYLTRIFTLISFVIDNVDAISYLLTHTAFKSMSEFTTQFTSSVQLSCSQSQSLPIVTSLSLSNVFLTTSVDLVTVNYLLEHKIVKIYSNSSRGTQENVFLAIFSSPFITTTTERLATLKFIHNYTTSRRGYAPSVSLEEIFESIRLHFHSREGPDHPDSATMTPTINFPCIEYILLHLVPPIDLEMWQQCRPVELLKILTNIIENIYSTPITLNEVKRCSYFIESLEYDSHLSQTPPTTLHPLHRELAQLAKLILPHHIIAPIFSALSTLHGTPKITHTIIGRTLSPQLPKNSVNYHKYLNHFTRIAILYQNNELLEYLLSFKTKNLLSTNNLLISYLFAAQHPLPLMPSIYNELIDVFIDDSTESVINTIDFPQSTPITLSPLFHHNTTHPNSSIFTQSLKHKPTRSSPHPPLSSQTTVHDEDTIERDNPLPCVSKTTIDLPFEYKFKIHSVSIDTLYDEVGLLHDDDYVSPTLSIELDPPPIRARRLAQQGPKRTFADLERMMGEDMALRRAQISHYASRAGLVRDLDWTLLSTPLPTRNELLTQNCKVYPKIGQGSLFPSPEEILKASPTRKTATFITSDHNYSLYSENLPYHDVNAAPSKTRFLNKFIFKSFTSPAISERFKFLLTPLYQHKITTIINLFTLNYTRPVAFMSSFLQLFSTIYRYIENTLVIPLDLLSLLPPDTTSKDFTGLSFGYYFILQSADPQSLLSMNPMANNIIRYLFPWADMFFTYDFAAYQRLFHHQRSDFLIFYKDMISLYYINIAGVSDYCQLYSAYHNGFMHHLIENKSYLDARQEYLLSLEYMISTSTIPLSLPQHNPILEGTKENTALILNFQQYWDLSFFQFNEYGLTLVLSLILWYISSYIQNAEEISDNLDQSRGNNVISQQKSNQSSSPTHFLPDHMNQLLALTTTSHLTGIFNAVKWFPQSLLRSLIETLRFAQASPHLLPNLYDCYMQYDQLFPPLLYSHISYIWSANLNQLSQQKRELSIDSQSTLLMALNSLDKQPIPIICKNTPLTYLDLSQDFHPPSHVDPYFYFLPLPHSLSEINNNVKGKYRQHSEHIPHFMKSRMHTTLSNLQFICKTYYNMSNFTYLLEAAHIVKHQYYLKSPLEAYHDQKLDKP